MPIAAARPHLTRIRLLFEELENAARVPSRLELDLLREHVRRFYEALDEVGPYPEATDSQARVGASDAEGPLGGAIAVKPFDLGRARERFLGGEGARSLSNASSPAILEVPETVEADILSIEAERRAAQEAAAAEQARIAAELAVQERKRAEAAEQDRLQELRRQEEQTRREAFERQRLVEEQAQREQAQREQVQREQAQREQVQREQARREQAQREQAQREQAQREQVQREQARREQAQRDADAQAREDAYQREQAVLAKAAEDAARAAEQERRTVPTVVPTESAFVSPVATTDVVELPRALRALFKIERANDLSDRLANLPIENLSKAMSMNDSILVKNELFGGSKELMDSTLLRLNGLVSYEAATQLLAEPARQFDWTEEERETTARTFVKLVRRRYA